MKPAKIIDAHPARVIGVHHIATDCSRFAAGDLESILVAGPLTVSRRAGGARFLQASTSGWKGFGAETRDVL